MSYVKRLDCITADGKPFTILFHDDKIHISADTIGVIKSFKKNVITSGCIITKTDRIPIKVRKMFGVSHRYTESYIKISGKDLYPITNN